MTYYLRREKRGKKTSDAATAAAEGKGRVLAGAQERRK